MAVGACRAWSLFVFTLCLYIVGFQVMISFWNRSFEIHEDTDRPDIAERSLTRAESGEDSDDYRVLLDGGIHGNMSSSPTNTQQQSMTVVHNNESSQSKSDDQPIPITMITKARWEAQQEQRQSQLAQACHQLSDVKPPLSLNISDVMLTNKRRLWPFIVNDKYQLMYCYISKVGSTHWKMAFLVLQGKYKRVEDIRGSKAHDPSLKKLSSYKTVEEISHRLDTYKLFVFVRNPFARVISGYRSKLLEKNPVYHKSVGRTIVKRYRKTPTAEEIQRPNVTFPEFVKYLTDNRTKNLDGHFQPMYRMVLPCSVRFDYIGKLETAEEDATYILQKTHVEHLIHFKQTRRNVSEDQSIFEKYFSKVPREDVKKLYQMYYPDFRLFGYELPEYMKSWVR